MNDANLPAQWWKTLNERPVVDDSAQVAVRDFAGSEEGQWRALHRACFGVTATGRRGPEWTAERFAGEFTRRPWWQPARILVAELRGAELIGAELLGAGSPAGWLGEPQQELAAGDRSPWVGSIALTGPLPGSADGDEQTPLQLNWLAVYPAWRRRGVAERLVAEAERRAWDWGVRCLAAQTLHARSPAARLFQKRGYEPRRELPRRGARR